MSIRNYYKKHSNNKVNPNQNICTQAVTKYFGTENLFRYLHKIDDIVTSVRKKHTVRSRTSQVKNTSVAKARQKLQQLTEKENLNPLGYIIGVPGHALLLSPTGDVLVDTAPRQRDRRIINRCYVVY